MTPVPPGGPALRADALFSPEEIALALGRPTPTDEQRRVIAGPIEPTLVVAGAGAGKTETMASRVVWLVANGIVGPSEILGLTFTRKAAQQLSRRIRTRLDDLARSPLCMGTARGEQLAEAIRTSDPQISTYHSYAGTLVGAFGLLVPVEPDTRLLTETEVFRLAHEVVSRWESPLSTSLTVAVLTERVLRLADQLSEHLVTTDQLRAESELLSGLVQRLPPGPGQKSNPRGELLNKVDIQAFRLELADLVDAVTGRMRSEGVMDYSSQMSLAARIAVDHDEVGRAERRAFRAVLLDEYQDTGHSQRVLLSSLFGRGAADTPAVTAVGDPMQSIYGWRGASASNLARFRTDFPLAGGSPAREFTLARSWRNPPEVLAIANALTAPLRTESGPAGVPMLTARPDSGPGEVRVALLDTIVQEREWVADRVAERFRELHQRGDEPTAAVLVRRNADSEPLADALRARDLPVEVVGTGGLLDIPEVRDVVALLSVVARPGDDTSALRLLTGASFRLGAQDLRALAVRARALSTRPTEEVVTGVIRDVGVLDSALSALTGREDSDSAGLAEALADPGPAELYTSAGAGRIARLAGIIADLRPHVAAPPARLVSAAAQALGLDVEVEVRRLSGGGDGREHLDALRSEAAAFGSGTGPSLEAFLDHLELARRVESGLDRGRTEPQPGRVQILTVHAAKGMEWQIIAVPHLCERVFPSGRSAENSISSAHQLPEHLRGDRRTADNPGGAPTLRVDDLHTRKDLEDALTDHANAMTARGLDEDRRLCYVAVTRSKRHLLVSGHHWAGSTRVHGPSQFLREIHELCAPDGAVDPPGPGVDGRPVVAPVGVVDVWTETASEDRPDVLSLEPGVWPGDTVRPGPLVGTIRRAAVAVSAAEPWLPGAGSGSVPTADTVSRPGRSEAAEAESDELLERWDTEAAVLLAERRRLADGRTVPALPLRLTASEAVAVATDPEAFVERLRRPVPFRPDRFARRGTRFHSWLEHRFGATHLLDVDDLPGAGDDDVSEADLAVLQASFEASEWAVRTPVEVEVPFEVTLGDRLLRGRMDAVFSDPGGWVVVDWKTGRVPGPSRMSAVAVQLAVYRHAWATLATQRTGTTVDPGRVRAVFHYVRENRTVEPPELPDADGLTALLDASGPVEVAPG